jgi:hypothetical protein
MVQKSSETKIRKLPLPLNIKIGNDTIVTDGLFSLTSKEASEIRITSIDEDGYITCEIFPPLKKSTINLKADVDTDMVIGAEISKSRGRAKDYGQYKYYQRPDGGFYAIVFGKRVRRLQLGKPLDRDSPISIVAKIIIQKFNTTEFSKKQLTQELPKNLRYGQILKAVLDVMKINGYLEKREAPKGKQGRLRELFKATEKLKQIIITSPEQT